MSKAFETLRSPTRFQDILRHYPNGSHWLHTTANLLASVVVRANDALVDCMDLRHTPRLVLSKHNKRPNERVLILTVNKRRKHIPIAFAAKDLILGDHWICLDDSEGPMRLVSALVNAVEEFYSNGH